MIKIKRAAWTADLPLHFQARLYDLNRQLLNARSETKIKHHEGIKWENKSTEFLDTTSITKSNSDFPTFPSENTKTTGKRGENGEKTGRKRGEKDGTCREKIGRRSLRRSDPRALCSRRRSNGWSPQLRLGLGTDRRTSRHWRIHWIYMNLYEFIWIRSIFMYFSLSLPGLSDTICHMCGGISSGVLLLFICLLPMAT